MTKRQHYFNQAAGTWDERFYTPELAMVLARLVPRFSLKPGDHVLDVGTGTGVLIPLLRQAIGPSGSITAIDYAEKMIQRCRTKYAHLKNVSIELHDVEELELPPESFDAITCFGLFPHLVNKVKALGNLYRVLKPGGRLIIAHAYSRSEIKARHYNASSAVASDALPDKSEMKQLLQSTGFARISINNERYYLCISIKP
jgi:ubiquinone/menaquinone biosynthesis C-methylase UbiE